MFAPWPNPQTQLLSTSSFRCIWFSGLIVGSHVQALPGMCVAQNELRDPPCWNQTAHRTFFRKVGESKIQSFPTITLNQRFPASTTKASGFSRKLLKMREVSRIYSNYAGQNKSKSVHLWGGLLDEHLPCVYISAGRLFRYVYLQ